MSGNWRRMLDPGTIQIVLLETEFGNAWCWHLGLEIVLLGAVAVATLRGRTLALVAALAVAHAASLAWAGHAVMHPGVWHVLIQAVHILAGGLWLGSLPALFHLAARARHAGAGEAQEALRRMLPLYSRAGYAAVGLVVLTGLANSSFMVASVAALTGTAYGRVLLAKIFLVLVMIAVAAVNRFALQPKIGARGSVAALWLSIGLEQAVAVLVLAAVSVLGMLPPAMTH